MTNTRIKLRRDTANSWTSNNPTLELGEPGYEQDTKKIKIGDGSNAWILLDYFSTNSIIELSGIDTESNILQMTPQIQTYWYAIDSLTIWFYNANSDWINLGNPLKSMLYTINNIVEILCYISPKDNIGLIPINSYIKNGFADYNDSGRHQTATRDIPFVITNDKNGSYTQIEYLPAGITTLWDAELGQFTFSELSIGDQVILRVDLIIKTTHDNQDVSLTLNMSLGSNPYDFNIIQRSYKNIGMYNVTATQSFYMGNSSTISNPATLSFLSDYNAGLYVNGWYISVFRR